MSWGCRGTVNEMICLVLKVRGLMGEKRQHEVGMNGNRSVVHVYESMVT